jgi:hypothetical protein
LQGVVTFASQEITQTKLCRVVNVHRTVHFLALANVPTEGVSQQN